MLFAPDDTDPRFTAQVNILQEKLRELGDRQVIVLPMTLHATHDRTVSFYPAVGLGTMPKQQVIAARTRFHIAPCDFIVILLGKDGGEKLRAHEPVPWARLRDLIDSMPMRQHEMRQPPQH